MAVIGPGATGLVLAAALLDKYPETYLVGRNPELGKSLREKGISVSGEISYRAPVKHYAHHIQALNDFNPTIIFICTKTFHLEPVLKDLQKIYKPGMKIFSTQNGLGPEDVVADIFGKQAAFRMSLNYGVALKDSAKVQAAFFNRPNHLGCLSADNQEFGKQLAGILTDCGLDTQFVDDIKLFVWRKMIMKCTLAAIGAISNRTIKESLEFLPTREIADTCFMEALEVARAMGYDLGEDYLVQALGYLEKVGQHKDSMCHDIENQTPTEVDYLGGKIVDYARAKGISVPTFITLTNLIKALEDSYLQKEQSD
jgi:2-dehydropantoate 2-reductase